jgi:hypothetical protein
VLAELTANDNDAESAKPALFVALNTSPDVVATTVGVPLITPLLDRLKPAGSVPLCSDHVIGVVPVAVRVKL